MCAFKFIKLSSKIHSPWSITDPQISIEWDPVIYSRRIVLSVHCTSALHFTCCITSHRSCTVGHEWISGYDLRIRSRRSIFIEYHSLVGQVNLYICISDIIGRAVIGRIEVNRVEISLCFVLDRLQKCLRRLLLVDAPAVIAARIQVNGRAKTRFLGMRQPEGVRLIRHMAHKSCRFVLRNRVGSILPLYEPAL